MAHAHAPHHAPHGEHHGEHHDATHGDTLTTYLGVFVALMVLLVLTVAVSFFHFGVWNPVIAMTIAFVKALLVIVFFMHMRHSTHLTWVLFGATLFFLGLLIVSVVTDVATRNWSGETGFELLPGPFEQLMIDDDGGSPSTVRP